MNEGLRENPLSNVMSEEGVLEETAAISKDVNLEEQNKVENNKMEAGSPLQTPGEPPVDWFEPLEDEDDAQSCDLAAGIQHSNGEKDAEEESLAGESERSGSVAGSERNVKRKSNTFGFQHRRRAHADEGWEPWPVLGSGWKRKEVVRRSGNSVGQKDVYYLSPTGERFRSRVELSFALHGILDMTTFEFKSGRFVDGHLPSLHRGRKRKIRESSPSVDRSFSSESSLMDRREQADTPDSNHRLTPGPVPTIIHTYQRSPHSRTSLDRQGDDGLRDNANKLTRSTKLTQFSINGLSTSEGSSLTCAKCGSSFIGTTYDKQRKKPWCPKCWTQKAKEHPGNRKKLRPCGKCVPCHIKWDCGQCASCITGQRNPASQKPVRCRKRKCLRPIRKDLVSQTEFLQTYDTIIKFPSEPLESQKSSTYQNSDTEDFSVNVDVEDDEDDGTTDDDDDWHKKRKRRACGKCNACLRKDCGTCDFCVDKPKFGGSNKKRQKCRLRQCQRQAMRHLLPFQLGQAEFGTQDNWHYGRPKPAYTYTRKTNSTRNKTLPDDWEFSDEQDDHHTRATSKSSGESVQRNGLPGTVLLTNNHSNSSSVFRDGGRLSPTDGRPSGWERAGSSRDKDLANHPVEPMEELPMITQIFSLAENPAASGMGMDHQLLKLLELLRTSALPILWYAIMVEGPRLQLLQCSKQSCMTDTIVNIDPGFSYQITVQGQPLLFTHILYETHPSRLTSVTDVVSLLLDLEKCKVCQGLPFSETLYNQEPVIFERASTCDFLVRKDVQSCPNCRALSCG